MRYRALTADGDYTFGSSATRFLVDSPGAVAQAILTRLKLWQGEWFLNLSVGVPYETMVLGVGTHATRDQAIKLAILDTQGVVSIEEYASQLDTVSRAFSVQAVVETQYGQVALSL